MDADYLSASFLVIPLPPSNLPQHPMIGLVMRPADRAVFFFSYKDKHATPTTVGFYKPMGVRCSSATDRKANPADFIRPYDLVFPSF